MMQPEINSAVQVAFVTFTLGMVVIAFVYGPQLLKERWKETGYPEGTILSADVGHYFEKNGLKAFNIGPVKNTTNWYFFLIKDNTLYTGTVYTNGEKIVGHTYSPA